MSVAYGGSIKHAGLDGHVIQPKKLKNIAESDLAKRYLCFRGGIIAPS
ncbi:hypothetical protein [Sideroxydans sp. CL21]|nr:hypothetical protein [Sideroxydans sp. CL21]